ncbi:MAG TPA: protein-export chaperone SecB [Syntrophomonadaceae bacterium]|nr:protein-export chaperone SecB [Syntrophomonadaceae bacterium]
MQAVLRFGGFVVEKAIYYRNSEFWSQEEIPETADLEPIFRFAIVENPNDYHEANIVLGVQIGEESSLIPFRVELVIRGYFQLDESVDKDLAKKMYAQNAIAILFPYLRSLVTDLTARSNHAPILLPTLNIIKVAEQYFSKHDQTEFDTSFQSLTD